MTARSGPTRGKPHTSKGKKGGFRVGPAHPPKGAYLGKAKRIKSELISRAKIKKSFYKGLARSGDATGSNATALGRDVKSRGTADEGKGERRAWGKDGEEMGDDEDDYRLAASSDSESGTGRRPEDDDGASDFFAKYRREEGRFAPEGNDQEADPASAFLSVRPLRQRRRKEGNSKKREDGPSDSAITERQGPSKEERMAIRARAREAWKKRSTSEKGGKRGQPDLGARMEVMLERIQRGA